MTTRRISEDAISYSLEQQGFTK